MRKINLCKSPVDCLKSSNINFGPLIDVKESSVDANAGATERGRAAAAVAALAGTG